MGQSTQIMHMLTKPQAFYNESHKTALGYQNPLYLIQAQRKVLALYCGHTIVKQHDALSVIDTEETLELVKESRLKMHAKQNDPTAKEKKVNIAPIDYVALNKLSKHFVKHFPQMQLFAEHAFWLPISKIVSEIPPVQPELVKRKFLLIISQDLVHTAVNTLAAIAGYQKMEQSYVDKYNECLELKTELSKKNDMVDKCRTELNLWNLSGLISSTSASGSKPPDNTKKNRISRPTSSNKKNKVEDHPRSVKSSLNKNNHVSEPVCNAKVKHSVLNTNSELIYTTCNECKFDAIHDLCVLDYLNDVNVCNKPKSVKSKKKKVWKPMGKVYSNV
ncbi:hypothetical protein Tco_0026143 [Tanacetum coccineum]